MFTDFSRKAIAASLSIIATAATFAGASSAQAADVETRSVTVRYADLDLASAHGATQLERRVARAARTVCAPVDHKSLDEQMWSSECRTVAIANAMPQVQLLLAAVKTGTRVADAGGPIIVASR